MSEDQVNDLVVIAYDLTERARRLAVENGLLERDLDKLRAVCEALSDRLVLTRTRAKGPKGNPVADRPSPTEEMRELTDEEWTQILEETAPLPRRQLSFYDV